MRTYHGERTELGCKVTVDGRPLQMRSDLSGNATTAFDWGYAAAGQLSLALLADYFRSDHKAVAMAAIFEENVIAILPKDSWTLTDEGLALVLAPLVGIDGVRANDLEDSGDAAVAFGDMPVASTDQTPKIREG